MKKLMVLGGMRYAVPIIKAAHELGVYVITADYLPDNIAHKYSDEYCNISIIDKEATLNAAKEHSIDGIVSFACDPGVVTAAYVAEKMGLPSCGSYDAVSILQDKGRFRAFLTKNHFNVPVARSYKCVEDVFRDVDIFHWPVIVKPTDSAGSKGVTCINSIQELEQAAENALAFSRSKEFVIEDYLAQVGYSSDTDSFSIDGKLVLTTFNSQRFDSKAANPYTPAAYSWPSSMSIKHQEELAGEIQRLITLLNLKTSIYNIETRESIDGKAYIMECSPRGGGNRLAECIEYATGAPLIENVVRAALGMDLLPIEQKDFDGYWAEIVLHSEKDGTFKELWIEPTIRKYAYEEDLWISTGDEVRAFSSANWAIGTLVLRFDSEEIMHKVMDESDKYVKVLLYDK